MNSPVQKKWPNWPEGVRSIPNILLWSALFSIKPEPDRYDDWTKIESYQNMSISIKGKGFNQTDLDVLAELMHRARNQNSNTIIVSAHSLITSLTTSSETPGSNHYKILRSRLDKMQATLIEMTINGQNEYSRSFIVKRDYDRKNRKYRITFDDELRNLFKNKFGHTYIDHKDRVELGQNRMAKC